MRLLDVLAEHDMALKTTPNARYLVRKGTALDTGYAWYLHRTEEGIPCRIPFLYRELMVTGMQESGIDTETGWMPFYSPVI